MAACASSALRYVTKAHPAEAGAGEQAVRPRGCKCTLTSHRGAERAAAVLGAYLWTAECGDP
eukprot:scaffold2908_cov105-Isochrysis_galbana.AAC.3